MSQNFEDTILALATGSLHAATALIRISGNAASTTANILGFKLQKQRLASVAILKDGELVQIGTPEDIINCPNCEYVSRFVESVKV